MRLLAVLAIAVFVIGPVHGQEFPPEVDLTRQLDLLEETDVRAMQVDARGDVYLAGLRISALSDPTVHRIGSGLGNGTGDLIVIKLSSALDRVYFVTLIGGSETETFDAMKVDADGNVYIVGVTFSKDFQPPDD